MIQELLLHIAHVLRVRVPRSRRHAHAIPKLLRGEALCQLEEGAEDGANVIRGNLVRSHRAVIPLAGGGVEPNLGDLRSAFLTIGLETSPFAVREAEVTSHVDCRSPPRP